MKTTLATFYDRIDELELYYLIMLDLDNDNPKIKTSNNSRFFKILKSNYILMLYNLVESCTVSGILEIYERLKDDNCMYKDVIDEIKEMWITSQVSQVYSPTTSKSTYEKRVKKIIESITQNSIIELDKSVLKLSGNLDAKRIKLLCDKHRIRYNAQDSKAALRMVKEKRNSLAHGSISFSDCARDLTLNDLRDIKIAVINFMEDILKGMENYYEYKEYSNSSGQNDF